MQLDFPTFLAASSVVYASLGLLLLLFWIRNRRSMWLAWAAAGFGALNASTSINLMGDGLTGNVRLALASDLLLVGFALIWQAMRVFEGRKPLAGLVAGAAFAVFFFFLVPSIIENRMARLELSSLTMALGLGLAAWEAWRGRFEDLPSKRTLAVLFAVHAALFAIRLPLTPFAPSPLGIQPASNILMIAFYGAIIALAIGEAVLVISMTLERSEKTQRNLAVTDPLTGMLNRRGLEMTFEDDKLPASSALIMFDLDSFKLINDNFGHAAGDKMIACFALICREELRQVDEAVRLGGEEFALVLSRTDQNRAREVAERIRERYADTVVPIEDGAIAGTVSGGFFCASAEQGVWLSAAIASADHALYRAKSAGRNRVCESRELASASRVFDERCVAPKAQAASF